MKYVPFFCFFLLLVCALGLAQSNPIPLLNQPLVPASVAPGSGPLTLTVNGTGFTSTATLYWNGSLRNTTVVSASTVQAQITAADVAKASVAWVTVGNLGVGEVFSNVIYFPIRTSVSGLGFVPRSIQNLVDRSSQAAVGDFNNDGLLDFAVGSGETIQVFLGKGNGTFQPPVVTTQTGTVSSMVAGDFNGDGKLDLAAMIAGTRCCTLSVFLGKGDGTFTQIIGHNGGDSVLSVADFNGDGKLDLFGNSRLHCEIFLGNGDGTFPTGRGCDRNLPSGYGYPAIADFNGDGKLDLAIAGFFSGKSVVAVFLGVGDGGFTRRAFYSTALPGFSVAAADVNADGIVDLVTEGVSVLLGKGDGTFRKGVSVVSGDNGSTNLGDFNGDGKLDIAAGSSILLGKGNGKFQHPLTFAGLFSGGYRVGVGGFNADGNLDLLGIDALNQALTISVQIPVYLTPTKLDFGSLNVGTTSPPQPATLTNFGAHDLIISSINITGANAADFAQTNGCGKSLPPSGSCKIQTTFTPSLVGSESAALNVTYKGSAPLSMPLSGIGTEQTNTVRLTPSSLTYGLQLVGTTSPSQAATLANTGNQPVTISSIVATAPFSQTNDCPSTLPVNGSCQIQVVFAPTDHGIVNGTLSVTDDAVGSPQTVALSGTGTAVVISPTAINFGNQKVGTSSVPVPVTLSNLGVSALPLSQIMITGANAGDFKQTNDCGTSVPAQGQCKITVTFTPAAKGARSAAVSITDDDPTSPQSVPLSGNGT